MKPVCDCIESNFGASVPSGFFARELSESFLNVKCAVPSRLFVPDFVITLTNPEVERPNSAFAPSPITTISLTASRLNVNGGRWPPRCSPKNGLLKSAPSTEMLFSMPFWPLIDSSSPSGPCTIATFGVSSVRFR